MIIYGAAALLVLGFLIGPLRSRTLRRLDRLAPGSVAFTIANRKQFSDPLSLAAVGTDMGEKAATLTSGPAVTADDFGLSFWDNTPFAYVGTFDWDRIQSIAVRDWQTPWRRFTATAIVLDVSVDGAIVRLPLLSPNGTSRIFGSRRESAFLAAQLETLRSAAA